MGRALEKRCFSTPAPEARRLWYMPDPFRSGGYDIVISVYIFRASGIESREKPFPMV
jgi:hypothetical protein